MSPSPHSTKSGPDVSQLEGESLSTASFPAPRSAAFRVYFDPQAYSGMKAHASEDVSFEICGVLVGEWGRDADGPFVAIRNYVRCDNAAKKFAEVTFTHESWAHINKEMDTKFQDQRIVGWYHSHPNFGIFLSDRDVFIQQNFFSGPGQIALVVDPVRKIEGVFEWRNAKPIPSPHYWVGSHVLLAPAGSGATGMPESAMATTVAAEEISHRGRGYSRGMEANTTWMLLAGMGLFLMGWMISGWRTEMERRAIIEGTVAHLGIWGLVRPGLEDELGAADKGLVAIADKLTILAKDHLKRVEKADEGKDDKKVADQTMKEWKKVLESTAELHQHLRHTEKLYSLTREERDAVRRFVEEKWLEASKGSPSKNSAGKSENEATRKNDNAGSSKDSQRLPSEETSRKPSNSKSNHNAPPNP